MSLDGTGEGGGGWSARDLLAFVRNLKRGPQPADDPIAQYLAARAQDARRPPAGGLFGSGYAAYMADNAPPVPTSAAPSAEAPAAWLAQLAAGGGQGARASTDPTLAGSPGQATDGPDQAPDPDGDDASGLAPLQVSPSALSSAPPMAQKGVTLPSDVSLATVGSGGAADPDAQLAALRALLAADDVEGRKPYVYPDSSKAHYPTVGIGHKVMPADHLKLGDRIGDARIEQFFARDGGRALAVARAQAAEAGITDPNFIVPLASVNFQLGPGWTAKFPNAWDMIKRGDYAGAAGEVAKSSKSGQPSDWYKQSKSRVIFFQNALRALPPQPARGR